MESELMPCPVCGESCTSYREFAELPAKVQCDVMTCNYALESASRAEGIEQHNTLCRRAEIGRLVEAIVALDRPVMLSPPHKSEPDLYRTSSTVWCITKGASLLDALRALAAEIGGV